MRQQGFALLELAVAVLVVTLMAVWGAGSLARRVADASAQASAVWMLAIREAAHGFIGRYAGALATATEPGDLAHKGYADWTRPSLAELKADHLLSAGFPDNGAGGLSAAIHILRGGACPDACRVEALVHSTQALAAARRPGQADEQMIAQWLLASQGHGGFVSRLRPHLVAGSAFEFANPPPGRAEAFPVGTVAMAVTAGQLGQIEYLRVADTRDPDFQGRATVSGDIETRGSLRAGHYVHVGAQETALAPCAQNGAVAREYYGGLLVCRAGVWRSAGGGGGGGGFASNTLYGCRTASGVSTANPATGACSCPVGHTIVLISDSGTHAAPEGRTTGYLCVE